MSKRKSVGTTVSQDDHYYLKFYCNEKNIKITDILNPVLENAIKEGKILFKNKMSKNIVEK